MSKKELQKLYLGVIIKIYGIVRSLCYALFILEEQHIMKRKVLSFLLVFCALTSLITAMPITANATKEDYFTYQIMSDKEAWIIRCDSSASGQIVIPDTLGGYPVTSIYGSAFMDCAGITGVTIPDSVTSVNDSAFYNCTGLTNVTMGSGVTNLEHYAFAYCSRLTSINIPDSVTYIGNNAFDGCESLTSIAIPDNVTFLGYNVFRDCTALENVTIGNSVTAINEYAFCDCASLTRVVIPDSVTSIGKLAFLRCSSLTSVTIGNGVTSIGESAFKDCIGLTDITIPDSVTSIESNAFLGSFGIENIKVDENNEYYSSEDGNLFNEAKTEFIQYAVANPSRNYKIPDSVNKVATYAFYGAKNLTSISVGKNVTTIDKFAFCDCASLTSVSIPKSVKNIKNGAFYGCTALADVYYAGTKEEWGSISIVSYYNDCLIDATKHYEVGFVSIIYNLNGGVGSIETTQALANNDAVISTKTPTRLGHKFLGWAEASDTTEAKYQPGDTIAIGTEDITLYAVWEKTNYTSTSVMQGNGYKIYQVTKTGIHEGSMVIFACYNNDVLTHIETRSDNNSIFMVLDSVAYDEVRVFVWDLPSTMRPITEPEDDIL